MLFIKIIRNKKFFFLKDLSESLFETFEFKNEFYVYSLRFLCISTDHPLELFTLLFKIAPFLQHIRLIQTYNSSLKLKNNDQLYDCINFVICQCQQRLKCLHRLHIQLRSISDQVEITKKFYFVLLFFLFFRYFLNRLLSHQFLSLMKSLLVREKFFSFNSDTLFRINICVCL
jgi:hypothetical protein